MGFSNERMRTGQLVNWFLLDGLELTPAGYPVTQALSLPFGVDHLIGFNELLTCKHPENAGVHFFLDDYQFERFWRMPERYLYALEKCPLVIGPDFSLYTDFPAPIQHWNHYRNQLLTAWLQHNGVCAIPTVLTATARAPARCGGADPADRAGGDAGLRQSAAGDGSDAPEAQRSLAGIPAQYGGSRQGQRGGAVMGGRGSSMKGSQGMGGGAGAPAAAAQAMPAIQAAPAVQAAPQRAGPPTGANGFGHLTPQQVSAMESAAQRQMMRDPALAAGVTDYINPVMQSNGKALSQNANWAAATGQPLTKRQQQMLDAVDKLAKPIVQETTLYRADHSDFLERNCGLPANYSSMSDAQIRKTLVGKTWTSTSLESTAYDSRNNPFWPQPGGRGTGTHGQGGIRSGNREILIRYHTAKSARAAFIQPSQSEAVLAVGTHHKITGVRSTRLGPSRANLSGKKVLELEIEVW